MTKKRIVNYLMNKMPEYHDYCLEDRLTIFNEFYKNLKNI